MKKVVHRILKILFLIMLVVASAVSCKTTSKQEKFYERQEAKNIKAEQKKYEKNVKTHKENQSKETQKMIRQTERESKKLNKSHKVKMKKC
jgi:hypothetical protein